MKRLITLLSVILIAPGLQAVTITKIINNGPHTANYSIEKKYGHHGFRHQQQPMQHEGTLQPGEIRDVKITTGPVVVDTGTKQVKIGFGRHTSVLTYDLSNPSAAHVPHQNINNLDDVTVTINQDGNISLH